MKRQKEYVECRMRKLGLFVIICALTFPLIAQEAVAQLCTGVAVTESGHNDNPIRAAGASVAEAVKACPAGHTFTAGNTTTLIRDDFLCDGAEWLILVGLDPDGFFQTYVDENCQTLYNAITYGCCIQ